MFKTSTFCGKNKSVKGHEKKTKSTIFYGLTQITIQNIVRKTINKRGKNFSRIETKLFWGIPRN